MPLRTFQFRVQALVTVSNLNFSVAQALGLVSEATDGVRRTPSSSLDLNSLVVWELQPFNGDRLESELGLTHEAKAFGFETVADSLGLSQLATREVFGVKSRTQQLDLVQTAEYGFAVRNLSVASVLNLDSDAGRAFSANIVSSLNLSSIAFRAFVPSNDLGLTSVAEWGYGLDAESILDLTHLVELNKILNQNITTPNVVSQAVTYFFESRCNRYSFNSFHGEGGVAPAPKRLNYANTFYLQSIDDGTVIQLRNPETEDRQRYAFNRINRNLFDGTPDVYVDDNWVTEESQLYTIVAEKREKLEPLFTFLQNNLGREIIVKDWKGVTWVVIVTNPGDLYTEDGEDYWTLNFEVEGEAFDGEWFFSYMNLVQDVSRAGSIYNRSATHGSAVQQVVGRGYDVDGDPTDLSESDIISQSVSYTVV